MEILILVVVLIFISAFFSLSETGITGASRGKIYKKKLEGSHRADQVIKLLEKKDRLITTILLGNTAVNIAASALVTAFLIKTFGDGTDVIFYATVIMTMVLLIFTEVLPKVFALKNLEKVALFTAPVISLTLKTLFPLIITVEWIVGFFLRIFGLEKKGMEGVVRGLDALRGALELYHTEGDVFKEDKDMLGSIIDLDETEVSEIMQHRKDMEAIDINSPSEDIVKQVLASQYSRMPFYENSTDNVIGILYTKALLQYLATQELRDFSNVDFRSMLIEPWFVPESTTLKEQLIAFREKRQHFALVVDEYGSLMGMITLEDILEEIVGNINDEYDTDYLQIEEDLEGSFIVDGTIPLRDINREMHWNLPIENATTLAGLIINEAQMIPAKGQIFNFYGFRFEILKKKRNQITKIKINRLARG
jgi:Mg2+/Co2+ transporter CorB